ncbi:CotH kinase family protein [Planctomycetes bacterium K23_9]|uniref:CotH kinase family protein n=1 Tax=Stieleria marina TaxID=1930275 RepID=UPI0011A80144
MYSDNHVLDIRITLSADNWKTMQPEQAERGRGREGRGARGQDERGGRGGGPPNRRPGPPDGPRRGGPPTGDRPQGEPPGGGPPQGRGGPPQGGGPGGGTEFTYVKAQIEVDGETYADVGLRFKGNSSYRSSANSLKRPMKIHMNKYNKKQSLHGRDKLNLSNAMLDSAFMKEKLAYGLYESAGLAAPEVGWANVTLTVDGKTEPLGIYVLIEQVDKQFMKNHFGKDSKDSLLMKPEVNAWEYLGDNAEDYAGYDIKYGEKNARQFSQLGELLKLINDGSDSEFESEIGKRFDLPQLAGYLAATSLLSSLDSYVSAPHNYYLMLDKADGKMRLLPWDVNESFAAHTRGASVEQLVDWDIDRPWIADRRLLERLFKTEDFPTMYRTALSELTKEFTAEKLFPQIEEYRKAIAPHVGKYKAGAGTTGLEAGINGDQQGINRSVDRQVLAIKPFIQRRHKSVAAQLADEREGQTISQGRGRR